MTVLETQDDYFKESERKSLPARCPYLQHCKRRAHTLAIANKSDFETSAELAGLRKPYIEIIGESPGLVGGETAYCLSGQCPEVNLFETSVALLGFSGKPTVNASYDKNLNPNIDITKTGHYSECAEYAYANHNNFVLSPADLLPPEKITFGWLVKHVPVSQWLYVGGLLIAIFCFGVTTGQSQLYEKFVSQLKPTIAEKK